MSEEWPDADLVRIFIAWKLRDARRAEDVLSEADIDYVVGVEQVGRTIFGLKRNGAVFYVAVDAADQAAARLTAAGLGSGVVPADAEPAGTS